MNELSEETNFVQAVTARVALGVITLLAMSSTMGSIQQSLPPVAYTKVREYMQYNIYFSDHFQSMYIVKLSSYGERLLSVHR